MFFSNQQIQRRPNALGVENFHASITFATTNDVDFTDIAKAFADRWKSRLTFKMSNATLSKHSVRRK